MGVVDLSMSFYWLISLGFDKKLSIEIPLDLARSIVARLGGPIFLIDTLFDYPDVIEL